MSVGVESPRGDGRSRFVLIADARGGEAYHVGDLAMLVANVERLRAARPDVGIDVVCPASAAELGLGDIVVHPPPAVPAAALADREARERWLAEWRTDPCAARTAEPLRPVIGAAEAVIVSGGGNLDSAWTRLLLERAALVGAARAAGRPVVAVGQTLGPRLEPLDRSTLRALLADLDALGVRESGSFALARDLGVAPERLHLQLDDAWGLAPEPGGFAPPTEPWIAVTAAGGTPEQPIWDGIAAQLERIARATGAALVLVPHAGRPDADRELARRIASRLVGRVECRVAPLLPPRAAVWLQQRATITISWRYHPVVFSLAGGVPALAVHADDYTRTKLRGALDHLDLGAWSLAHGSASQGALEAAALELWRRRHEVARHLAALAPALGERDRVDSPLRLAWNEPLAASERSRPEVPPAARPAGSWAVVAAAAGRRADHELRRCQQWAARIEAAERAARAESPAGAERPRRPAAFGPPPVAATIASRNYLARARTWARSLARYHPELRAVVFLADEPDAEALELAGGLELVAARDLGIPGFAGLAFRSNVLELGTAIKPFAISWLFDHGAERVLYFDPDILVCDELEALVEPLEANEIVVTPHLIEPTADPEARVERSVLVAGVHNLGFLGVRAGAESRALLSWWGERLLRFCRARPGEGLYADQRWIDLLLGFSDRVAVVRHPGANVAYWNIRERHLVARGDGRYRVVTASAEEPLLFFHFSGFDPLAAGRLSCNGPPVAIAERPDLEPLVGAYREALLACGEERCRRSTVAYDRFSNGEPIAQILRDLLRESDPDGSVFEDPFDVDAPAGFHASLRRSEGDGVAGRLSRLAWEIWRHRPDVQRCYPRPGGEDRAGFVRWLKDHGAREHGLPTSLLVDRAESGVAAGD